MEDRKPRDIKDGSEYDHLFPRAKLTDRTVKRGATVSDTVKFIPKVVRQTRWQTEKITHKLKRDSVPETCNAIWDFGRNYFQYKKDDEGREQIRSPARAWHDRFRGIDCDCYTVLISTILSNLQIPHTLRITKYREDRFQHIYPIVPLADGDYITIDCVVEKFDYEEPYREKQDTNMELQFLDGLDDILLNTTDAQDLFGDEEIGKLLKKPILKKPILSNLIKKPAPTSSPDAAPTKKKGKVKEVLKKVLNVTNKVNPATVLLRNGLLAAMKLNVMNVASRIKYGYLKDEDAKKKGMDMGKFQQLKKVREKLENIFFGAGGKTENLKTAILTGKGNANKDVAGLLGYMPDNTVFEMNERTPLPQLIGSEIWHSENVEGMEDFEGLGDLGVVAAAAVGTSAGALAIIASLLDKIGNLFPKNDKAAEDFKPAENTLPGSSDIPGASSMLPSVSTSADSSADTVSPEGADTTSAKKEESDGSGDNAGGGDNSKPEGFWEKNKKWLKPTLWGLGGLSVLFAGFKMMKSKKEEKKAASSSPPASLSGLKSKKKNKPNKSDKKQAVALL